MQSIKLHQIEHDNKKRIALTFTYNHKLIELIKTVPGYKYSQTKKIWHYPATHETYEQLKKVLQGFVITEEGVTVLTHVQKFKNYLHSKRYSASTIGTYCDALKIFLDFYKEKPLAEISNEDIIRFNVDYILAKKLSAAYQNQVVNAIKLFFGRIENRKIEIETIHRPKREKLLPNVLSKEEIKLILEAHANLKHKVMLSLIYSCGLRRSELLKMKIADIDSRRKIILVKQAKGKKDRIVPLSLKILDMLRVYYTAYKPKTYLFEGQLGSMYSEGSLEGVLKQALLKAKIKKPVSLHWLRHSYATHLLESGTDLRYIQEILGHSSSKTTEIYTHVSTKNIQQIKSPFDDL